ncbi:creatininase [Bordetella petrii]|uniref:creatininase n=1 Tax=Bordetella petrii TaxID=94624 RepID=UPI00047AFD2D|nr:creatininase [Bordetella petrii]
MQEDVRVLHMTWQAFGQAVTRQPIVIVPCGAIEQHGPHLPLGVDAMLSEAIALDVARQLGGLVMPPLSYGYKSMPKSGGGPRFPGTTNLDGHTYMSLVGDLLREMHRHGVRRLCFLNGHFENQWFLTEGIDLAMRDPSMGAKGMRTVRIEYWDVLDPPIIDSIFPEGLNIQFEHAAAMETSLMLHYFPQYVLADRIPSEPTYPFPPYDVFPADPAWGPVSGSLSPAQGASAEKGRRLARAITDGVAKALRHAYG